MEWIKVSDRLPNEYQTVLAYGKVQQYDNDSKYIVECWYKNDCFQINADIINASPHCDSNDVLDVTHWMMLPQLPKD